MKNNFRSIYTLKIKIINNFIFKQNQYYLVLVLNIFVQNNH